MTAATSRDARDAHDGTAESCPSLFGVAFVCASVLTLGCGERTTRMTFTEPEPFPVSVPRVPPVPPVVDVPPDGTSKHIPPADKQDLVMRARLDRMVVGVVACGGNLARTTLSGRATSKLAEIGLNVRDLGSISILPTTTAAGRPRRSRSWMPTAASGVDVLLALAGSASPSDKFGNFHSYEARCRGRLVDPLDGRTIASKQVQVRGPRALKAADAEASALGAAGDELAEYLTDELVRKVEHRGYLMRVVLAGVKSSEELDRIRAHLQASAGVAEARTVSWSKRTRTARLLVRMSPGTKANLAAYLETVPEVAMEVTDLRSRDVSGERLKDDPK